MAPNADRAEGPGYELLDAGVGRRLERFGERVVDRPAPAAAGWRADATAWSRADLRFDAGGGSGSGWFGAAAAMEPWVVEAAPGLRLELRPTSSGGIGLYPEHLANLAWVAARVADRLEPADAPPTLLHLFAHTGLVTLAAARAGAAVTHVDAARGPVAWARRNAQLSGLDDRPVRWLVDDAAGFVAREARRRRRYDVIVLDPPSFGRAKQGRRSLPWRLEEELPALLAGCAAIAAEDAALLLTTHTTGLDGEALAAAVRQALGRRSNVRVEELVIEAASGARLELGWSAAIDRRAPRAA